MVKPISKKPEAQLSNKAVPVPTSPRAMPWSRSFAGLAIVERRARSAFGALVPTGDTGRGSRFRFVAPTRFLPNSCVQRMSAPDRQGAIRRRPNATLFSALLVHTPDLHCTRVDIDAAGTRFELVAQIGDGAHDQLADPQPQCQLAGAPFADVFDDRGIARIPTKPDLLRPHRPTRRPGSKGAPATASRTPDPTSICASATARP